MAILTSDTPPDPAPSLPPPPTRPPLFVRTLIPPTPTQVISLSFFPPHALHPPSPTSHPLRQLVAAHATSISVYTLHSSTLTLYHLCTTPTFSRIRAIASVTTPVPHRDVLLVLADPGHIHFLQFDEHNLKLRLAGAATLPSAFSPRKQARLLATHPTRPIVAVATLAGGISVFPVLFLPKSVSAGKIASVKLQGVILSLDFVEDDGKEAILVALVQTPKEQVLQMYSVSVQASGALSLNHVAGMITCASHPDDTAVARATSKLTGEAVKPTPPATGVCRLQGCPMMFAVFVRGKVIAADARSVLRNVRKGEGGMRVRIDDDLDSGLDDMSDRFESGTAPEEGKRRRDFLSYLYIPSFITLDIGEENGVATAWSGCADHFGYGGVYFAMESGAMFALRWDADRKSTTAFSIPGRDTLFGVDYVGDIGPAVGIASLGGGCIYIANECADGSLRKIHTGEGKRYGLEVRQEVVNFAPVSDFIMAKEEIIAACGMGRQGCVRVVNPGAPVLDLGKSEGTFTACNDMWPIKFGRNEMYHAGVVMTFAQGTGVLYSVPGEGVVAELVNGTEATGILQEARTLAVGCLEDGVLAQVHEAGVRVMVLKSANEGEFRVAEGEVRDELFEEVVDWKPAEGRISVGCVGAGFILVFVVGKRKGGRLCLLKFYRGKERRGMLVVGGAGLEYEISAICIPEWTESHSDVDLGRSQMPPMAMLATYAPSVEVRLLGPTMELVESKVTFPWTLERPTKDMSDRLVTREPDDEGPTEELIEYSKIRNRIMTAVPQSLAALEVHGRYLLFAGLRDGSVLCFSFANVATMGVSDASLLSANTHLIVESHRKLGHRPVVLKAANVAFGKVIIAQAERTWVCASEGSKCKWFPMAFMETRAVCAYSVPGAKRCFAAVGVDDALHICALRRKSEVSVRSIYVGATPRRVANLSHPEDSIIIATAKQHEWDPDSEEGPTPATFSADGLSAGNVNAELRVYHKKLGLATGFMSLLPGEQVHVLFEWLGFIVVGTSFDLRSNQTSGVHKICKRGRLMLISLRTKPPDIGESGQGKGRTKFQLCTEIILPGAVLAGTAHATANVLFISCNEEVIAFGVPRNKGMLVEIARASVRAMVVSISVFQDVICIVDRKDSIGFFTLDAAQNKLERDRTDHRRRIVSDSVMVDRTLAVAVDRRGAFFSVGYELGDGPAMSSPMPLEYSLNDSGLDNGDTEIGTQGGEDGPNSSGAGPSGSVGEEFDVMQVESESENTNVSNDNEQEDGSEGNVAASVNDSVTSQDDSMSGTTQNGGNTGDGTGTNTANLTQTTEEGTGPPEPNVPGITNAGLGNIGNQGNGPLGSRVESDPLRRNLVCHHSFNLNDTALVVRVGNFKRREGSLEGEEEEKSTSEEVDSSWEGELFTSARAGVFCATLGGSFVVGVPMRTETYLLLSRVEGLLSIHPEITGPALGSTHVRYRSAFNSRAVGTVDGDLLEQFESLSGNCKQDIAAKVGFSGEKGVLHIEGLIRELFDRAC